MENDSMSMGGFWGFLIFAILLGGGNFFGGGNNGNANAIQADVNRGFDNQNLQAQTRDIMGAVTSGTAQSVAATNQVFHDLANVVQDKYGELQRDIAGGGYFYDLAPHQIDLLQDIFGPIVHAKGFSANRGGLYQTEDSVSASFQFHDGLPGSGSWCFVCDESARTDRIELIGDKGQICFSVFTYEPIALHNKDGRTEIHIDNPKHVQMPLIESVVRHLQGKEACTADNLSATSVNWVMDRILGKI